MARNTPNGYGCHVTGAVIGATNEHTRPNPTSYQNDRYACIRAGVGEHRRNLGIFADRRGIRFLHLSHPMREPRTSREHRQNVEDYLVALSLPKRDPASKGAGFFFVP